LVVVSDLGSGGGRRDAGASLEAGAGADGAVAATAGGFSVGLAGPARSAGGADGADTAAGGGATGVTVESADLSLEGTGPGTRSQIRTATLTSATAAPTPCQR